MNIDEFKTMIHDLQDKTYEETQQEENETDTN